MTITAKITDIQPDTSYQGTTYENRVIITFQDTTFGVFDPDMHANQSMIGKLFELDILPFLPYEVDLSPNQTPGIIPNKENPKEYSDHKFCGEIIDKMKEWPKWLTLNLGSGVVRIKFYENPPDHIQYKDTIEEVNVGEMICVTVSRTDLHGVESIAE